MKFFGQQVHVRFEKIQEFFSQITARAQENFTGVRVVRAYAQEGAEIAAFNELNRQYSEKNLSLVRLDALMRPLMQFLIGMGFVLILWVGVPLAIQGEMTVGQFTVFNMYLYRLDLAADRDRIRSKPLPTRHCQPETDERNICCSSRRSPMRLQWKRNRPLPAQIEFRNLTLRYNPNDEPVLQGHQSANSSRANGRDRRTHRQRQINAHQSDSAGHRGAGKHRAGRWRFGSRLSAGAVALEHWIRAAGNLFVQRHAG